MNDIILSILVPTYGHEKYIREALDSILMQNTKYKYEVIIGEDASPDNTREILREYEKRFPDKFIMVYRDVNAGGYGKENFFDLINRARGKYITVLEGDDFYLSEFKLQEQISFLEENEDFVAVSCNTQIVDEYSEYTSEIYPECKDNVYSLKHFRKGILPGQTACLIFRSDVYREILRDSIWSLDITPSDQIVYFATASVGKIYCIQKVMVAYRHILRGGTSYSANIKRNVQNELKFYRQLIEYARRNKNKDAEFVAEARFFAVLCYEGILRKDISIKEFIRYFKCLRHKIAVPIIKVWDYIN